ncbi:ATP-binding protein [Parabacteroides sp. AM08-6]|uniref:hybrid sensor histidine kinase/response regulator n=1 Tax=Parabacteroides sp. AM08-6 TaxID=2292053 RepID=UPI000EFE8F40|nr:ATP-binding protein [Parabacteroides sp. AM08-6]RHJ81498.1 response regulator [Parabacteroides sp. AM08-6]
MSEQNGHITLKVIVGYLLLIIIAVCSVLYIYDIIEKIAAEDDPGGSKAREKVYLVTNTLSLLYESEAMGQLIGMPQGEINHFNRALNKALQNMDTLRTLVTDSILLSKIDTIKDLIQQKRRNTRNLLETWQETNAEHLYTRNIEEVIARQDTVIEQVGIQERVIVHQDTVKSPNRKSRGFFRRLADVFAPPKEDTSIVVNTTRQIVTDTLVNAFNPADTIVTVLKSLQDSVADQRRLLINELQERAANLRYNNSVITSRINQMLRDIEEDEMNASLERVQKKQKLLSETSFLIAGIAVLSLIIVVVFIVMITRDLSRSQYYRQQLEKAKLYAEDLLRKREKLMLTISHDIRAPLSSIIGYIELLQRRRPDERQQYYLENMGGSAEHILSLVNGLLDFHRLESGKMEIQHVPFSVSALFNEIYASFRPIAEAKQLEFVLNLKEEGMERIYMGDPIRMRQVVSNLLSNAIKFTHEGRIVLLVKYSVENTLLAIIVSDSGPGIPQAEQEKIFGEFTRLSTTEKEEGFGLGLSITKKLIEVMGGTLSLESIPGKGSDFKIELPLKESDVQTLPVASPEEEEEEISAFADREVHCLLVDDDPLQLALTEEFLKRNHVQVSCCTNPYSVPGLLQNTVFDAVITDIQMPEMDGFQLLDAIRTSGIPGADSIPVIALSASLENEHTHYLEAGFTGFLNKPFTAKQLISLLNELLSVNIRADASFKLDFASLTAFAGEDKEASDSIIRTFTEETNKSISLLRQALDTIDKEQAGKISHKLIPLFTMLGATELVAQLRVLEKNDEALSTDGWQHLLADVITRVSEIVRQAATSL